MKDKKGLYYYPFPWNKQIRTYVRESEGSILFRLWSKEDPGLWLEHGWVPHRAIKQAAGMFRRGSLILTRLTISGWQRRFLREPADS